jgi:hypothetical protein
VRVAADASYLYLAAEISDERLLHPGQPWFHGDSLELFLNTGLVPGEAPPASFAEGCWQILLMPANPQLAWGVIYRGQQVVFGDGGLRGVRIAHRLRPGVGYDLEVALPRLGLGLAGPRAREVGFALALTDADMTRRNLPRQDSAFDLRPLTASACCSCRPAPAAGHRPGGRRGGGPVALLR